MWYFCLFLSTPKNDRHFNMFRKFSLSLSINQSWVSLKITDDYFGKDGKDVKWSRNFFEIDWRCCPHQYSTNTRVQYPSIPASILDQYPHQYSINTRHFFSKFSGKLVEYGRVLQSRISLETREYRKKTGILGKYRPISPDQNFPYPRHP